MLMSFIRGEEFNLDIFFLLTLPEMVDMSPTKSWSLVDFGFSE
jgi:hypothetical protein